MLILRDPAHVERVQEPRLRALITQRFAEVSVDEPYDPDVIGDFAVAEPGDTLASLESALGAPILHSQFSNARFGEPDYEPCHEFLEEHVFCFEVCWIYNDGGYGLLLFVPKVDGMDAGLLDYCRAYAVPAALPVTVTAESSFAADALPGHT